jgi:hypothetical protein
VVVVLIDSILGLEGELELEGASVVLEVGEM